MRHFSTNQVTSYVLKHSPSAEMRKLVALEFSRILEPGNGSESDVKFASLLIDDFVFDGHRQCANALYEWLAPAEFRVIVALRVWFKAINKDLSYRSPRYWTRSGDFVYVNVNTGKSFVFIDGHYWD